jgi:hypothetical protein
VFGNYGRVGVVELEGYCVIGTVFKAYMYGVIT